MRRRHQRGASFAVVRSGCNLKLVPFEGGLHCDGRAPGPVHTATPLDMHNFGADFDYEGAIFGIQEFYQTCEFERARRRNLQLKRFWWRRGLEEEQEEALARDELALTSRVPIPEAAPRNPHRQELVALERRLRDLEEERFCWREAQDLQEHIAYLQDEIDAILHEQDLHRRIRTLALEREAMLDSQELRRSRLQQLRDAEKQQELRQRLRACVAEKKALQREQDDLERSYRSSQLTTWQKEKELQHRQKVLDRHSLRMQAPKKPPGRPLSAPGGRRPTPATSCGGSGDFYAWRHSSGVPLKPSARAPAHWAPGPRSPQSQAGTLPRQVRLQEPLAETDQTQLPLAVAQEASDAANQVNQEPEKPADPPKDVPSPAGPPKDAPAPDGPPKDAPAPNGPPKDAPAPDGPPKDAPAPDGPPKDAPAPDGPPKDAPAPDGPPKDAPAPDGTPEDAPAPDGPPKDAPAPDGPPKDAPAPDGPPKDAPAPDGPPKDAPAPNGPPKDAPAPDGPPKDAPAPRAPDGSPKDAPAPARPPKDAPAPDGPPKAAPAPDAPTPADDS